MILTDLVMHGVTVNPFSGKFLNMDPGLNLSLEIPAIQLPLQGWRHSRECCVVGAGPAGARRRVLSKTAV